MVEDKWAERFLEGRQVSTPTNTQKGRYSGQPRQQLEMGWAFQNVHNTVWMQHRNVSSTRYLMHDSQMSLFYQGLDPVRAYLEDELISNDSDNEENDESEDDHNDGPLQIVQN